MRISCSSITNYAILPLIPHHKQLLKVNAAASALYEAAPKGTLLVLVCQDSLTEAIRMKEEKLKARYIYIYIYIYMPFQCILVACALYLLMPCYTIPFQVGI